MKFKTGQRVCCVDVEHNPNYQKYRDMKAVVITPWIRNDLIEVKFDNGDKRKMFEDRFVSTTPEDHHMEDDY